MRSQVMRLDMSADDLVLLHQVVGLHMQVVNRLDAEGCVWTQKEIGFVWQMLRSSPGVGVTGDQAHLL